MHAHGSTTYQWHGDILESSPRGNFNEEGIIEHMEQVALQANGRDKWVLFERPKTEAGITPEAIDILVKAYENFAQKGCIMVVIEVPGVFGSTIGKVADGILSIPFHHGNDPERLKQMAEQALQNSQ